MDQDLRTRVSARASSRAKSSVLTVMKRFGFSDPVSGVYPESGRFEESVSALVALHHHLGRIAWDKVQLRSFSGGHVPARASDLIEMNGALLPEFPLLHSTHDQEKTWGSMKIDLLYFHRGSQAVGVIDSKLGSPFQYEPRPETVQPARYLEFVLSLAAPKRFFLFATSEALLEEPGYLPVLQAACDFSERRRAFADRYVMAWEDVIRSFAV